MKGLLKILLVSNVISFLLSIVYVFLPDQTLFWNAFGLVMMATLTGNILVSFADSHHKSLEIGYLILSSAGMLVVMGLNTITSLIPSYTASRSIISIVIMLSFFVMGAILTRTALLDKKKLHFSQFHVSFRKNRRTGLTGRRVLLGLIGFLLVLGLLMAFFMLVPISIGVAEVILSQYSLFYSLIFLSLAGLFLKLSHLKKRSWRWYGVLSLGGALFIAFNVPLAFLPSMLSNAQANYSEAFGESEHTQNDDHPLFRSSAVSLPDYFFGIASEDYNLKEGVLYYEGSDGVDDGLELRYDVYTPPVDTANLPGERAVLIRIHGGGWNTGGRGIQNFSQVNKYFASQGYVVFDVEYGLNNQNRMSDLSPVAEEVSGEFSVDDMVRHLGLFTTYLADNFEEYDADINSVFLSGGSAGGHLANAVGIGLASGQYPDLLDERLTVSGIMPLYPANGLAGYQDLDGEDELVDPGLMVDENSPPALVYQGDMDRIVDPRVSEQFEAAYLDSGRTDFALIRAPYGEHVSDLYFPGYYSQMFVYYMERFMQEYK